ncbi:TIM-barrel domain-containing protein [Proteiniphilum sp.]|uniref:glycoside hydrolase family 31 protein n=1 Tax=Proteiniphilum sp. TaxID=1926877 RepID=UPI0033341811
MKRLKFLLLIILCSMTVTGQNYERTPYGIKTTLDSIGLEIQFFNPSTVRILKSPAGWDYTKESLAVIEKPEAIQLKISRQGDAVRLESGSIEARLNLKSGNVSFYGPKGEPLLNEKDPGPQFTRLNDAGRETFSVYQPFVLDKEEAIYGLGILQNGKMNQRNQTKHLVQGNVEDVVTFIQSVKGYGLYWDNYSPTTFADNEKETSFSSEVGDCIDYYFMYGGNADGVIAQMRNLTGQVPMFPLWTYGYWQSRERYKSQSELLEVVSKYRELGVPLDGIIQDWQYWGNNYLWNAMEFLNPEFPNPEQMINEVHNHNAHVIISIWSSFGPQTKPYRELNEKGLLFNFKTWPESGLETWPPNLEYPSGVRVYDAYSPVARDIYWKNLTRLHKLGMDGWWMDSTEPDHLRFEPEDMDTETYLGSFRKVRNAYPLMSVGGVYENQRKVSDDKRVFILTRSGFAGQQRYGANVWSGDIGSSWESFRNQIPAGLNFTLTGNPNFNTDIGGFFVGSYNKSWNDGSATRNPLFQELYVRWIQQGAFTPMMRSHGTDIKREIYYFGEKGEPVYDAIEKAINLRYSFLPYIYSTSWEVTDKQSSFMRALVMDFVNDKRVWDIKDQYMFGKSILVAPIVEAQYTPEIIVSVNEEDGWNKNDGTNDAEHAVVDFTESRSTTVYLPEGTVWYDFWTNDRFNGGQQIARETSIDLIPLYVRAGSIIPLGPEVQYATEKKWDNLEIKVYTGADGSFTLYEDEFDNYNYEKGAYTEIPFSWNNSKRRLTIGARQGSYDSMLQHRTFSVILQDGTQKTIPYNGRKIDVTF